MPDAARLALREERLVISVPSAVAEGEVHHHRHVAEPAEEPRDVGILVLPVLLPLLLPAREGEAAHRCANHAVRARNLGRIEADPLEEILPRGLFVGRVVYAERIAARSPLLVGVVEPHAEIKLGCAAGIPCAVPDLGAVASVLLLRRLLAPAPAIRRLLGRVVRIGKRKRMEGIFRRLVRRERRMVGGIVRHDHVVHIHLARVPEAVGAVEPQPCGLDPLRHLQLDLHVRPVRRARYADAVVPLQLLPVLAGRRERNADRRRVRRGDLLDPGGGADRPACHLFKFVWGELVPHGMVEMPAVRVFEMQAPFPTVALRSRKLAYRKPVGALLGESPPPVRAARLPLRVVPLLEVAALHHVHGKRGKRECAGREDKQAMSHVSAPLQQSRPHPSPPTPQTSGERPARTNIYRRSPSGRSTIAAESRKRGQLSGLKSVLTLRA